MSTRMRIGAFVRHHVVSVRALAAVAALTVGVVAVSGVVVTRTDPELFHGPFQGWWWAATTITTVGYGDVVPASMAGRVFGIGLMFTGVALLAIVTASIAALLMSEDVEEEERHLEDRLDDLADQLAEIRELLVGSSNHRNNHGRKP